MKTFKSFIFAVFCLAQITFASSANSAEAYQISGTVPSGPHLYVIYYSQSTGAIVSQQQPYQIPVSSIFAAVQTATEKPGKNGGISYTFDLRDRNGNSTVTNAEIKWIKDGVTRSILALSQQHLETGVNWYFKSTVTSGKNTSLLREGWVNDILGSSVGGTRVMFNTQWFTVDGPGNYQALITVTFNNGMQVSGVLNLTVQPWYEPAGL